MESTATVKDEAKQNPSSSADQHAGGDDPISVLNDDELLLILGLVADARDVVYTGVLSRRWRDLWTRAPVLLFDAWPEFESTGDVERYVAFIDNVLAKRAQCLDGMELLGIPLLMELDCLRGQRDQLVEPSVKAAEGWIRYAAKHGVARFSLKLRLPRKEGHLLSDIMAGVEDLKKRLAMITANNDNDNDDDEVEEEDQDEEVIDEEGVGADDDDEEEEEEDEGQEEVITDEDVVSDDDAGEEKDEGQEEVITDEEVVSDADAGEFELDESSEEGDDHETPTIDLSDLPSSANLEAMCLDLDSVRVRLPSTVVFPSLTDLSLEFIILEDGSGGLLSRILSTACCLRLQKLQ